MQNYKQQFEALTSSVFSQLQNGEELALNFSAEQSSFMRFNNAKVRQIGTVEQADALLKMWKDKKTYKIALTLSTDATQNEERIASTLTTAREQLALLPEDPFQAIPTASEKSELIYTGDLIDEERIVHKVLANVHGLDFTGLYTQGLVCRGSANSAWARHWFQTETFLLNFSAWLENGRAIKSSYAGRNWSDTEYAQKIDSIRHSLKALECEQKSLKPGAYRAFITANALAEVTRFFSWNGLGERGIQQGKSAFIPLREGRESLSELFTLTQDFSIGGEPSFNDNGELAPEKLTLIEKGKLLNTPISSRTAQEYGLSANGAGEGEGVRSIHIAGGNLAEADALKALGTGIYVSNFHYLNWSDVQSGRITGMTRFSCMWVEGGKIIAPIKDMRWDDSLYNLLGANLEAITREQHLFPETSTYERRAIGSSLLPGILVSELHCTL